MRDSTTMNRTPPAVGDASEATSDGSQPATLDIREIMELLPHRYPFLMVDRIIEIRGDESCIGIKNVTVNEPFFVGHFPGQPVMPGVLLLEGMAQSAGVICARARGGATPLQKVYFLTVDKAKFRRPVLPGDRVEYHMKKMARRKTMWWYRGEAKVDGELACEAEVGAMIVEE
jgi:3-hydroxyacyl-[acyl-carrier-protein] dehydratase